MEEETAQILIKELRKHQALPQIDETIFLPIILRTNIDKSKKFQEPLSEIRQRSIEPEKEAYLSLRRVILNKNAKNYGLEEQENLVRYISAKLGVYSSNDLCRIIRANSILMEMISKCEEPFSLLGKLETSYFNEENKITSSTIRPILVIPNASNKNYIYDWEEKHEITYKKSSWVTDKWMVGFLSKTQLIREIVGYFLIVGLGSFLILT